MIVIVALLATLTLSSTSRLKVIAEVSKGKEQRIASGSSSQSYACVWAGHESTGVRLRFPLEAENLDICTFACKTIEKFSGFQERFVEAFSKNFVTDATGRPRCECTVNGGPDYLFSFKSSEALCYPGKCWEVYVKYADLGALSSERVGILDNYVGECMPCEGRECSRSTFKRIGLSDEEREIIFNAAASGDTEAQRIKELIQEFEVEPGQSISPVTEEDARMPAVRIQDDDDHEQDPSEFIDDLAPSPRPERDGEPNVFDAAEANCTALINTENSKVEVRLMVFMSSECGVQYQKLVKKYQAGSLEVTLPPEASEYICKDTCRQHPNLVEPLDVDVPPECDESDHIHVFHANEAVYSALMAVWSTCGSETDDRVPLTMSGPRKIKEADIADKFDGWIPQHIVGEDDGCNQIVKDTSPKNGQIGDTCTLHSISKHNLLFHTWVRTESTCGTAKALRKRVLLTSQVPPVEDDVSLRCYKPDGNGEMPEPGEKGICAIPKRKACGNLACPCRPGSHCVAFLASRAMHHYSAMYVANKRIIFQSQQFKCVTLT